jgi:hypothetical protein
MQLLIGGGCAIKTERLRWTATACATLPIDIQLSPLPPWDPSTTGPRILVGNRRQAARSAPRTAPERLRRRGRYR